MNRRTFALTLGLGTAFLLAPGVVLAQKENHLAEAIKHTKEAIEHGKMGHADVLTTHAEAALAHAEAGEKAKANPHTKEAITHLKQAIDVGKKGDAAGASLCCRATSLIVICRDVAEFPGRELCKLLATM